MLEHIQINTLYDYFVELNNRSPKGVYFYRINGYSDEIEKFIIKYYEEARKNGIVIEGKIPNPSEDNLSYYEEIMGMDFQMSLGFISSSLKKWLPRMTPYQNENVSKAIYDFLDFMRTSGKTENMIKNAYIKFMCWLYYKFERIINQLGNNNLPKILYEGNISNYELMIMSILSSAGCDIVLLQYKGDEGYKKIDGNSKFSYAYKNVMTQFPKDFSLKNMRDKIQKELEIQRLYGTRAKIRPYTNAWITGEGLEDFKKSIALRGNDKTLFYNCFYRINGVQDKYTYVNELYQFQLELKNSNRNVVIVDGDIEIPSTEEISGIRRGNYANLEQMIMGLSMNIEYRENIELQRLMVSAFVDIALEIKNDLPDNNLNRISNKLVYVLCWLKRYKKSLFSKWKEMDIGCFIKFGVCKNDTEAYFLKMLSKLPVDILVLNPNLNNKCCLKDKLLYELNYNESLNIEKFPDYNSQISIGTVAYHTERELDNLLYRNTGIYRNQQYSNAKVINLRTMYEEIGILWEQELKYRPNFSIVDNVVNIPVIFSKISGVKDGNINYYWYSIKKLIVEDTLVIRKAPYIDSFSYNPIKSYVQNFYKNGRLLKDRIKSHTYYPYNILREEMQDYILDNLEVMISQRLIKGIGENGMEYKVIATILNIPRDILRLIQKFDFTKKNPKLIYINTKEDIFSIEDTILMVFLNRIGFDIIFFVPTGYQCIEKFSNNIMPEEHQIGEYIYDLNVPNFNDIKLDSNYSKIINKIFKRGN